ncbi:MAG: GcrA family cell cycle regulator [Maricaulaceae bacterium]
MAWTEDRVEVLTKLWAEGLSASQIAKQLGGVTRNAVIGKVHRLGLSGRAKPSRPTAPRTSKPSAPRTRTVARTAPKPKAPRVAPIAPPPAPIEAKPLPSGEYATILTIRDHMCKWPIGDPSTDDFRFCGRKTDPAAPYCEAHSSVAYQPSRRRYPGQKTIAQPTFRRLK